MNSTCRNHGSSGTSEKNNKGRKRRKGQGEGSTSGAEPTAKPGRPTLPPEKWTPSSLPRIISASEGLRLLKRGDQYQRSNRQRNEAHLRYFPALGERREKLSDIRTRLKNLNRAVMAIRQPNEIWQNDKGERLYLSAQQYEKSGKKSGSKNYYVAISIKGESADISTYYQEEADKIRHKREGRCVYRRRP